MSSGLTYHLFITLPIYLLISLGLAGMFKKAEKEPWKAFVPVLNWIIWMDIIGKPRWWVIWFFIPVMNFIIGIGVALDLVRSFGKQKFYQHAAAVIVPFIYFPIVGLNKTDKYEGPWASLPVEERKKKKSEVREWLDAILFAGMAAILIRTFLIEAFMIPTTSMEGSLLAGDFLFVSKFHYGIRMPMVPFSMPFVHNKLPFTEGTKSFFGPTLPYSRLPGLKSVQRNEIVVFNYPDDDENADVPELGTIQPISMKQNYIKRCVATPGDTLEITNAQIYINGKKGWNPEHLQFQYLVKDPKMMITRKKLEKLGFRVGGTNANAYPSQTVTGAWDLYMTSELKQKVEAISGVIVEPEIKLITDANRDQYIRNNTAMLNNGPPYVKQVPFPRAPKDYQWTVDYFGPLVIPAAGMTMQLNAKNIALYRKVIDVYEDHDLEVKGGEIFIDGVKTDSYTFEMDYYWMMGDNRHGSLDSRFWGFVPEDHIVGRPWMVLFSWENGPRWGRFFNPVSKWEE